MTVWTHQLLDHLRQIGDPTLDPDEDNPGWRAVAVAPADVPDGPGSTPESQLLRTWRRRPTGALPLRVDDSDPFWTAPAEPVEPVRLEIARSLFVVYGGEIGASLLLASLPNAYAAEAGAAVLATTRELQSNARRRIGETAQFVVDVLFPDSAQIYGPAEPAADATTQAVPPGSRGYVRTRTTRLNHAVIRTLITGSGTWRPDESMRIPARPETLRGLPINQEDLLGTLGTFTVTVYEVMEKLGIPWTDEAEQAYLDLWDRVGELLGIGTPEVTDRLETAGFDLPDDYVGRLRPKTPDEARQLCGLIRERCWPVPLPGRVLGPFANANGKVLVRALLDELQEAMPRRMERLPLFVMRYLVAEPAHELLGLGGGGLLDSALRWPREEQFSRYPSRRWGMGLAESAMRLSANDISRRAFVHFIRQRADDPNQTPFWFPVVPAGFTVIQTGRGSP